MNRGIEKLVVGILVLMVVILAWPLSAQTVATPFESAAPVVAQNKIDEAVFARLKKLNLVPARLSSDAVFLRRAYLDVIGTLPTASEAQQFLQDTSPDKRRALIDRLLVRDEFADYLALKWGDLLRIKAEFPINLWPNAAQSYHRWVHDSIRDNKPVNQFARELLTASGSNFENPPVNFYRAMPNRTPSGIAQTVALTFMGQRAEHWPSNKLAALSVFFANLGYKTTAEWKEEIVFFNPAATNAGALNGASRQAALPDGSTVKLVPDEDPRGVFARWLVGDPQFARSVANRAWFWLMGRGVVEAADDFRTDNPPGNPALLTLLQNELVSSGYDFKRLYRFILNSSTYQLASISQGRQPESAENFACYPLRRMEAEVLIDALNQITGGSEKYSSSIPEPFTFIPENLRSIALPDGSITSAFLDMFGRPSRDTGLESERNNTITAAQKLTLLNSSLMQKKIEASRMIEFQSGTNRPPAEIVSGMYLGILSRLPTAAESKTAVAYYQSGPGRRQAVTDIAWALMNSTEFLYRH